VPMLLTACSPEADVDAALDSDANGYVCMGCGAKFYTDRIVFASRCAGCSKPNIEQAVAFICETDRQVNIGPRTSRAMRCQQCGRPATGLGIPRRADLEKWGAPKKSAAEVGG
jgi:DNA-directed RNA polymerase subunit RPC12/RpoP